MASRNLAGPRVCIVGAGLMGRWHAHAARRLGARVVAVVDPVAERAAALAKRHPGAAGVPSLDAVGGTAPEIAHICTPVSSHVDLATAAILRGMHVLIEKPVTANAAELRSLLDAAGTRDVLLCPVHQMAFQRGVERAADSLHRLGAVHHIGFTICSAGAAGRSPEDRETVAVEILPHPLSLLRRLWPDLPLNVQGWHLAHPRPGEVLLSGVHGAALLTAVISMAARPTRFELVVRGARGTLHLDLFHGFVASHSGVVSRWQKIIQPFAEPGRIGAAAGANLARRALRREPAYPGLRGLLDRFYRAALEGAASPVPPAEALAIADAVDVLGRRLGVARPLRAAAAGG